MLPEEDIPDEFKKFLLANDVSLSLYYSFVPRKFVYLYGESKLTTLDMNELEPIMWLNGLYRLPSSCKSKDKSSSTFYMDAASALAVHVLDPRLGEHILDLCCAPGMKLSLIGLIVGKEGSVTGVDISKDRLATCRSIVKKHKVPRCRLFQKDGRVFNELPLVFSKSSDLKHSSNYSTPFFQSTAYRRFPCKSSPELYDRVLVDAQCTHDGSIKHIQKATKQIWSTSLRHQFCESELTKLYDLQLSLLLNGFRMCRQGGCIVYSTCSFSIKQNEEIVAKFLASTPNAQLEHLSIPGFDDQQHLHSPFIRVDPRIHDCGFLFIAKIIKT